MQKEPILQNDAKTPRFRSFPRWAGFITGGFGLWVMVSWPMHGRTVPPLPGFPLEFNAALGFLLAGAGLAFLAAGRATLARLLGAAAGILGLLTLLEYLAGRDFGIDQFFLLQPARTEFIFPGRMPPLTAINFILLGGGIFLGGAKLFRACRLTVTGFLACLAGVVALVALCGHLFGIEGVYGWGVNSRMGVNPAAAFFLLSLGLLGWTWQASQLENFNFLRWLPVTSAVSLIVAIGFISLGAKGEFKNAMFEGEHTYEVLHLAASFVGSLTDAERGMRGYVFMSDPAALETYKSGTNAAPHQLAQLAALARGNPSQELQIKILHADLEKVIAYSREFLGVFQRAGLPGVSALEKTGRGLAVMNKARADLELFLQQEQSLLAERDALAVAEHNNTSHLLMFSRLMALLLLVITNVMAGFALRNRKRAEFKLRESEDRFQKAFNEAPIGMALVHPSGALLRVNRAICQMVGYTEAELLATDFQHLTHPEDLQANLEYVQEVLSGRADSYKMEKRYIHKNGMIVFGMLSVSLVRGPARQPLYFISQVENITERKNQELETEKMIAELQSVIVQVKTLSGLIPICGWCKSIRSDTGYWQTVEQYVRAHTDATFSHGMCPQCAEKFKDDLIKERMVQPTVENRINH